jgi:hypothetical protein
MAKGGEDVSLQDRVEANKMASGDGDDGTYSYLCRGVWNLEYEMTLCASHVSYLSVSHVCYQSTNHDSYQSTSHDSYLFTTLLLTPATSGFAEFNLDADICICACVGVCVCGCIVMVMAFMVKDGEDMSLQDRVKAHKMASGDGTYYLLRPYYFTATHQLRLASHNSLKISICVCICEYSVVVLQVWQQVTRTW